MTLNEGKRNIYYGEIKFFRRDQNYGFITERDSQEDYFFRGNDVRMKKEEIVDFLPVSFMVREDCDPKTRKKSMRAVVIKEVE